MNDGPKPDASTSLLLVTRMGGATMSEYYARLFKEVGCGLLRFWKEQIGVSVVVGVISAFVGEHLGTIDSKSVWRSALVSIVCYTAILIARSLWGLAIAPATLDRQRSQEIRGAEERRVSETAERDSRIARQHEVIVQQAEKLVRKHPHDAHIEWEIRESLEKLTQRETDFIRWLLDTGTVGRKEVANARFGDADANLAVSKTAKIQLVVSRPIHSANGQVVRDQIFQINEHHREALRNLLHPNGPR
jgi:hypothetical protein